MEQRAEKAPSITHRRYIAAQPGIETEAATGGVQGKEEHDDREEYVLPGPFGGAARQIGLVDELGGSLFSACVELPDFLARLVVLAPFDRTPG